MKNCIKITLVLLGMLSVPSTVFAEASWYGSLRAGLMSSGGNLSIFDGKSRWGIRGSSELDGGLTAVYQFEQGIDAANGAQRPPRLSYVGLSGALGTVTVGRIWSASYNSVGAITNKSWFWGSSQSTYRQGWAVSYAFSNDMMRLQIDAVYAGPEVNDPNDASYVLLRDKHYSLADDLESTEFGLSVNVGEIGKVAIAYVDDRFLITDENNSGINDAGDIRWSTKTTTLATEVSVSALTAYVGTQTNSNTCRSVFGGSCSSNSKIKTTFFGVRGGLGDTGLRYLFQWRDVRDSHQPWLLSFTKGLGNNVALVLEHVNYDDNPGHDRATGGNKTGIALVVGF